MAEQIGNTASERAVIAGLVKHGSEAFIDVDDIINVDVFTLEENQILYACLTKIFQTNNEVDFPSILSAAKDIGLDGAFENRISPEHVRAIMNLDIAIENVRNHEDIMNMIKKREWFRPFACSILEEKADEWFEMVGIKKSPYMMYAFQAKKIAIEKTPAIIHVDHTCRVQTVAEDENKVLYNILKNFKVPLIMNTSMNLAGDSMNETLDDALITLRQSPLKYIYLPDQNKLIEKII